MGNKGECRGCGQEIIWLKTKNGKNIPVDPETVSDPEAEIFDKDTMTTHFDTCPEAGKFRKGGNSGKK